MIIEFCCTPSRLWQHKNNFFFVYLFVFTSVISSNAGCLWFLTSLGECQIRSLLCFFTLTGIKCVQSVLQCIKFNSLFFLYVFKCVLVITYFFCFYSFVLTRSHGAACFTNNFHDQNQSFYLFLLLFFEIHNQMVWNSVFFRCFHRITEFFFSLWVALLLI